MALWTPYADETAIDLTKTVKKEVPAYNVYPYTLGLAQDIHPAHSFYPYVPAPQLSPLSGGSVSSFEQPFSPNRPLTLSPPQSPVSNDLKRAYVDDLSDDPDFQAFERDALNSMAEKNGGTLLGTNPRMRRSVRSSNETNDDTYRKQRERNNFAAKQSRDRRKLREIHLALKVTYLRKELAGLKAMLAGRVCTRCQQSCMC